MIKAVIFDMDGTLLNTLEDLAISTNYALEQSGFPKRTIEEVRNFIGDGVQKLIERSVVQNTDKNTIEECLNIFKKHYCENMHNNTSAFEGIIEILTVLKQKNIKIAIVSNKFDGAIKELCKKYFASLVDIAIGQSDDVPKKPAPDSVLKVLDYLNIEKDNAIYVGDSDVDILTAKNAKIKSVGVLWGYRDISFLKGADYIISKPDEILDIVLGC